MISQFKVHYHKNLPLINKKLKEFKSFQNSDSNTIFKEMVFCIFAANSSAKMGLLAQELLSPILNTGTLEDYKNTVYKKVRFYNLRSEYLFYNKKIIEQNNNNIWNIINHYREPLQKRIHIKNTFKGFGLKESSHFLRNIGFKKYAIIDKHVINTLKEFSILPKETKAPKSTQEYYQIEKIIKDFAKDNNFDIDALDLALWSYKTGKIIK